MVCQEFSNILSMSLWMLLIDIACLKCLLNSVKEQWKNGKSLPR
jgi:predicted metalloenzyme YecM